MAIFKLKESLKCTEDAIKLIAFQVFSYNTEFSFHCESSPLFEIIFFLRQTPKPSFEFI